VPITGLLQTMHHQNPVCQSLANLKIEILGPELRRDEWSLQIMMHSLPAWLELYVKSQSLQLNELVRNCFDLTSESQLEQEAKLQDTFHIFLPFDAT
jgi:hypothetical protein